MIKRFEVSRNLSYDAMLQFLRSDNMTDQVRDRGKSRVRASGFGSCDQTFIADYRFDHHSGS